jgi:hypothetical protein
MTMHRWTSFIAHKKGFLIRFFLVCAVLAPWAILRALDCTPTSATITYAADDYMFFYLNGNEILNGTTFDAGAPAVTVPIPVADFAAVGSPDYFAFEDVNSVANLISCTFLITITCADGSSSYITAGDLGLTMYNDTTGGVPPPPQRCHQLV